MTLQKVREVFRKNRWLRWQAYVAVLIVTNGIRLIATFPGPTTWWSELAAPMLLVPFLAFMAMALRLSDIQKRQREVERVAARELRTPRAPDAGPDQCPVCGCHGLEALAEDDAFMERGKLAKVVPWGSKRAHWDCAEWSPYVEPPSRFQCRWCGHCETAADADERKRLEIKHAECEQWWGPGHQEHFDMTWHDGHRITCACPRCERSDRPGAYRWCKFCGFARRSATMEAAKAELIAHARECPKRPRATFREINTKAAELDAQITDLDTRVAAAATRVSIDSARLTEVLRMLGKGF